MSLNQTLAKNLFNGLTDYKKYIKKHTLDKLVGVNLNSYGDVTSKKIKQPYYSVDPNAKEPFFSEIDDLCRLHYLIISRKVTTILEFGVGKSTLVFNDALLKNKKKYELFVSKKLRRSNPFECHSLDSSRKWIKKIKYNNNLPRVNFHYSEVKMGIFNDRTCTFYKKMTNICPDFVYVDGPDQFSAKGFIRGVTTNHPDKLPMSGDLLAIEHFLLPGTLIVVDGRTANARFLKANLQRNWIYFHNKNADQHFFELNEEPLGIFNKRQIDFCLGHNYYLRKK